MAIKQQPHAVILLAFGVSITTTPIIIGANEILSVHKQKIKVLQYLWINDVNITSFATYRYLDGDPFPQTLSLSPPIEDVDIVSTAGSNMSISSTLRADS